MCFDKKTRCAPVSEIPDEQARIALSRRRPQRSVVEVFANYHQDNHYVASWVLRA